MKSKLTIDEHGTKVWKLPSGDLHRKDSLAIEFVNGSKVWFLNGKYHREDGPAIECPNGEKWWYINGLLHREDGPAVEYPNGSKHWYINAKKYTEQEYKYKMRSIKLKKLI
jgi:hypothetical protein